MPLILAIESSTRWCSVALGDGQFLAERALDRPREHHALILPMVAGLLAECGCSPAALDAIAFGRGPGSFTGLRIATGFTQGLAFALDRPVLAVSSLDALALGAHETVSADDPARDILVAMDAHMGELFCGHYRRGAHGIGTIDSDRLERVEGYAAPEGVAVGSMLLAGDAWSIYPQICIPGARHLLEVWPLARQVLGLALGMGLEAAVAACEAEPHYVRGVSAWKTRAQQGQ